jgi:hypothetical protein
MTTFAKPDFTSLPYFHSGNYNRIDEKVIEYCRFPGKEDFV